MSDRKSNTVVITDTSCFIILEKIQALNLLNEVFDEVFTTPEIALEYGNPLPWWVKIQSVVNVKLQKQIGQQVDRGEASAIALAQELTCDYLLTDDLAARKFAENIGLHVKGSAGVLLFAKEKGIIKAIKPYLDLMQQTNFRISEALILRVLKSAGEK